MRRKHKQAILAVAATAALLVPAGLGCGGSDSGTVASLTKSEYLKVGDRICGKRLKEKEEVFKTALTQVSPSDWSNPSPEVLETIGEKLLRPIRKLTVELSELPTPAEGEDAAETVSRELKAGLKRAEADPRHLIKTDPFRKAGEAARAYGLTACNL